MARTDTSRRFLASSFGEMGCIYSMSIYCIYTVHIYIYTYLNRWLYMFIIYHMCEALKQSVVFFHPVMCNQDWSCSIPPPRPWPLGIAKSQRAQDYMSYLTLVGLGTMNTRDQSNYVLNHQEPPLCVLSVFDPPSIVASSRSTLYMNDVPTLDGCWLR